MMIDFAIGSHRWMDDLFSEALSATENHLDSSVFKTPDSKI